MDLKQLEYFRQIADAGSINEAARHLNMSQPPLSYQLRQLEQELNVTLFERSSQGVTLTEVGKLLYNRSGELLNYARSTELEITKAGKKRVLRIGITPTTVSTMMPYFLKFVHENPDVNFEIRDGITFSLYNYLLDGIIDISVVRTPIQLDSVNHAVLHTEPMIAVSSIKLHTDCGGELRLVDLMNRPLILYRRYEELIMSAFRTKNIEPDIFCICDDPRDALLWAKEGLATAIFPQSMEALCGGMRCQVINEEMLITQILLIWKKSRQIPPIAQEFLKLCLE